MGLFAERLRERRRQQHGAAALAVTDLGTPDLGNVDLTVRTSTKREQASNLRQTRVNQRGAAPAPKPVRQIAKCETCGIEVPGKNWVVRYCKPCLEIRQKQQHMAYDAARRNERAETPLMKPCAHCGTPMRVRGRAKYCSEPCRVEVKQIQGREKYERKLCGRIDGGWIERERRFNAARKQAKTEAA